MSNSSDPRHSQRAADQRIPLFAILAGGASRRMGEDKALLRWRGLTFVEHVAAAGRAAGLEVCVVGRDREVVDGVASLADDRPGLGPLGGLVTVLRRRRAPVLVAPVDAPEITAAMIGWLLRQWRDAGRPAALLSVQAEGELQPLFAVYAPSALESLERSLAAGRRSLWRAATAVEGAVQVALPAWGEAVRGYNDPERLRSLLQDGDAS